jgi:hypothetical protein
VEREMRILRVSCFLLICFPVGHYSHGLFFIGPGLFSRGCGETGTGRAGTSPPPPYPTGMSFSPNSSPWEIKMLASPSPNGRIPRGELGIGSPLPSLGGDVRGPMLPAASEAAEEVLGGGRGRCELTLVVPPLPTVGADLIAVEAAESLSLRPAAPVDEAAPTTSPPSWLHKSTTLPRAR